MNIARIENFNWIGSLSWRKALLLTTVGILIGLALALANRLPVS